MIRTTVLALALALAAPSALAASCTCGYQLKSYGNAYFRHLLSADFTTTSLSGTATGPNWLGQYGLYIADGYQSGAQSEQPDGTTPIAHYTNVRVQNGALQLVVPGGQKITSGGQTSVAEVDGPSGIINGVMTMNAKIDPTAGTCQSIFTYHNGDNYADEQDIEILSSYLYKTGSNGTPPGVELTNYNPTKGGGNDYRIDPFPSDPAAAFHNYTIAWLPSGTTYYFDKTALNSPTKYSSKNPSSMIINHWTNGDSGFTQGPPASTAVMSIKQIVAYYTLQGESGLPSGCAQSQVCIV